jgi:hypothetical protein
VEVEVVDEMVEGDVTLRAELRRETARERT